MPGISLAIEEPKVVHKIVITGNKRTLDRVILYELTFKTNDYITDFDLKRSRQNLMNIDLFSHVDIRVFDIKIKGMVDVQITVKEKWSILPLPKLARTSDAENRMGMRYQDFNLTGRGYYLDINVMNRWANDFKHNLGLFYSAGLEARNFLRSRLNINTGFSKGKNLEETFLNGTVISGYNKDVYTNNLSVSREFGEFRYFEVGGTFSYSESSYEYLRGVRQSFISSKIVSLGAFLTYDNVSNLGNYIFEGYKWGLSLGNPNKLYGSDINAIIYNINFSHFILLNEKRVLAYRFKGAAITGNMSKEITTNVGGSTSLRGYEKAEYTGNRSIQMNSEYRFPLTARHWGGTVFLDGGKAWENGSPMKMRDLHWSTGLGLRLYIKRLVNGVGRLDWAYNVSRKEFKIYVGSNHTF